MILMEEKEDKKFLVFPLGTERNNLLFTGPGKQKRNLRQMG